MKIVFDHEPDRLEPLNFADPETRAEMLAAIHKIQDTVRVPVTGSDPSVPVKVNVIR